MARNCGLPPRASRELRPSAKSHVHKPSWNQILPQKKERKKEIALEGKVSASLLLSLGTRHNEGCLDKDQRSSLYHFVLAARKFRAKFSTLIFLNQVFFFFFSFLRFQAGVQWPNHSSL